MTRAHVINTGATASRRVVNATNCSPLRKSGLVPTAVSAPGHSFAALAWTDFDFATRNRHIWKAIHDHRLPEGVDLPEDQATTRGRLTSIIAREIGAALPAGIDMDVSRLTRMLIAVVHGHCEMTVSGSLELMGEWNPVQLAIDCVRMVIAGVA